MLGLYIGLKCEIAAKLIAKLVRRPNNQRTFVTHSQYNLNQTDIFPKPLGFSF